VRFYHDGGVATEEVRFGRIRITARAIEEVVGRTPLVSIPRAEVRRIVLRRGVIAERPAILIALGVLVLVAAAPGVTGMLRGVWDHNGSIVISAMQYATILALGAGPLLIWAALRRGLVLEVEAARGTRKLGVGTDREVDIARLDDFVAAAARAGLTIER
jgi:hypothetical protein